MAAAATACEELRQRRRVNDPGGSDGGAGSAGGAEEVGGGEAIASSVAAPPQMRPQAVHRGRAVDRVVVE
jgi:hypothetical protein